MQLEWHGGWNRPMDFDARRKEAWEFTLRGCSVYDYLDFTVAADDPTGTGRAAFPSGQYYNGETMRLYLKYLNDFIHSLDFIKMSPDPSVIKGEYHAASIYALDEKGKAYAVYINGSSVKYLNLELSSGRYRVQWFNIYSGTGLVTNRYVA